MGIGLELLFLACVLFLLYCVTKTMQWSVAGLIESSGDIDNSDMFKALKAPPLRVPEWITVDQRVAIAESLTPEGYLLYLAFVKACDVKVDNQKFQLPGWTDIEFDSHQRKVVSSKGVETTLEDFLRFKADPALGYYNQLLDKIEEREKGVRAVREALMYVPESPQR